MSKNFNIMFLIGVTIFVLGCGSAEIAKDEAKEFVVSVGGTVNSINCNAWDTDNDGYVSCNVSFKDQNGQNHFESLECPSRWTWNDMCKLPYGRAK